VASTEVSCAALAGGAEYIATKSNPGGGCIGGILDFGGPLASGVASALALLGFGLDLTKNVYRDVGTGTVPEDFDLVAGTSTELSSSLVPKPKA